MSNGLFNGACLDPETGKFTSTHYWYVESSEVEVDHTGHIHVVIELCCSDCDHRKTTDYSWEMN